MIERRCEAGITVAARHDFRFRPDLEADLPERGAVFGCCATGKENSSAIDLGRQVGKDRAQTLGYEPRGVNAGTWRLHSRADARPEASVTRLKGGNAAVPAYF